MKDNDNSVRNAELVRIAVVGIIGMVFFIGQELLSWLSYMALTSFFGNERWLSLLLVGIVFILQVVFLWFSINVALGILAVFTLDSARLFVLLDKVSRLPLLPDRWLLRPCVSIIKWAVVARQAPRSER